MKLLHKFLSLALLVSFFSCENETLEMRPVDLVDAASAFSTPDKIFRVVIGAYDGLQSPDFLSGRALIYIDAMGEDVYDRNVYFGNLPSFTMQSNTTIPSDLWTAAYTAIARANSVIEGVAANATILADEDLTTNYIAEGKFVRAVSYFYLVNFYGQPYQFTADASHLGVPLITQSFSSNDPLANQPRSSVSTIYQFIIDDLIDCLTELPENYGGDVYSDKTRGTRAAAAAMLSRVYLYMGDYENSRLYAQNILNGDYGQFALNTLPNAAFGIGNYQTAETIWSIPNNQTDNPNTNNALPMHYSPDGRADLGLSPSYLNTTTNPYLAADDLRRTSMIVAGVVGDATAGAFFTGKYADVTNRADWAPVIRYPEILLTFAETQTRVTGAVTQEAVDALNQVRDRAQVSAESYTTGSFAGAEDLISAILGERRVELAFEGHRFWDLMRLGMNVTNKYSNNGTTLLPVQEYGDQYNVFPIPQVEVDKSGGVLEQNPGY